MAGNRTPRGCRGVAIGLLCAFALLTGASEAIAGQRRVVPDVRRYGAQDARRRLEQAGFQVGVTYVISIERILATWKVRYPIGYVWMQNPAPGGLWDTDIPVDLMVSAAKDGRLPPNLPGLVRPAAPKGSGRPAPDTPAPDVPTPDRPTPDRPTPDRPAPDRPAPDAPAPEQPAPPSREPRKGGGAPAPPGLGDIGSPDAPRDAPKADPNRVPELVGLDLVGAEELIRRAKMTLYVERVAGHPVGRVLEQIPAAGAQRPPGGVVKAIVTAGGDFEGDVPGAPRVYVAEITVPNILDRTRLQAERIAEDLGLTLQLEEAKRGLPGRVVDQMPAGGGRLARGGVWRLWIGPGEDDGTPGTGAKPQPGPLPDGDAPGPDAPKDPQVPAPKPPLDVGPLPGGVPQPVAPGAGTSIPQGATIPLGFSWKGVQGASAYLLEVEEQGAEGRWMPLARKPARTTAVLLEVERLDPKGASRLRWRVAAFLGGRQGTPSRWVELR